MARLALLAERRDLSVAWFSLTDDGAAVEYHAARFVDLPSGGVREYHFTVRRYDTAMNAIFRFAFANR